MPPLYAKKVIMMATTSELTAPSRGLVAALRVQCAARLEGERWRADEHRLGSREGRAPQSRA